MFPPCPPVLVRPTTGVRNSYLSGERAESERSGEPTGWLDDAADDFDRFVARRRWVRMRWEVPTSIFWYVAADQYLGELVIRHELTPSLAATGGHVGYSILGRWRRQGHATRMLAAGLTECALLGIARVLLTCDLHNDASRRVILANGGQPDGQVDGQDRFWIAVDLLVAGRSRPAAGGTVRNVRA